MEYDVEYDVEYPYTGKRLPRHEAPPSSTSMSDGDWMLTTRQLLEIPHITC